MEAWKTRRIEESVGCQSRHMMPIPGLAHGQVSTLGVEVRVE